MGFILTIRDHFGPGGCAAYKAFFDIRLTHFAQAGKRVVSMEAVTYLASNFFRMGDFQAESVEG